MNGKAFLLLFCVGSYINAILAEYEPINWACTTCEWNNIGRYICGKPTCQTVELGDDGYCISNSKFKSPDGCNTCICSSDGKNAGCTKLACISP